MLLGADPFLTDRTEEGIYFMRLQGCFSSTTAFLTMPFVHCRALSLSDICKKLLTERDEAKALLPLVSSKKDTVRWMARQVSCSHLC